MEEQKAHDLYQHFSDVHAAAKSGRGLGFNAGRDTSATWKADENFERWQPSMQPDVVHSESSRPVTHKKEKSRHRSHAKYITSSKGDNHARHDDESKCDKERDRNRIDRDQRRKHADHHDSRSHNRTVEIDERYRGNRHNERGCNRRSQDYEHRDRRDREDARVRCRPHDSRSRRDERGREERHRAIGTARSRSEHCEHRGERGRDNSRDRSSHRERRPQDDKDREHRHRATESSHSRPDVPGHSKVDFERAIPGYAQMGAAERMKARTKLLLDKSSKQDLQHPKEGQWTRYVFNKDALLDEEGATPADGFSGDANAVSLRLPQAKAEIAQRMMTAEEAHEAAIFGKSRTSALPQSQPQREEPPSMMHAGGLGLGAQASWTSTATEVMEPEPGSRESNPPETIVAADVLHAQPGLSWRERAALQRKKVAGES